MKKNNIIRSLLLTFLWSGFLLPAAKENFKIALVYPSLTKGIFYQSNSEFKPTEEWELFFLSKNYDYEMLNDADLADISSDVSVVVVPSMEAVTEDMLDELRQLMDDGKGILITGGFAEYDENGDTRTRSKDIMPGFDITRVDMDKKLSVNHFLEGNTQFSIGLKPGQKILLSANPALFYAAGLAVNSHSEGNYILPDKKLPGIVSISVSNQRLLWFGFSLSQLIDKNRNLLLSNSLDWLSSQPEIFFNYWPEHYEFSAVVYKNIESNLDLESTVTKRDTGKRLNYFISPPFADKFPGLFKNLSDSCDVNITWDDFLFSRLDSDAKTSRLNKLRGQINEFTGQNYFGVSSYGEFMDSDTYRLLRETGYSFIFSSGYSDSYTFDYDTTFNLYRFYRPTSGGMQQTRKSDIHAGGIFYANMDSLDEDFYSLLSSQNCWITTFSGQIEWAEKRKNLSITINNSESGKYEVNIKNNNASDIYNAGIWISIPHLNDKIMISSVEQGREMTFDALKKMYFLTLSSIGGYQEISFKIPGKD